MSDRSLIEWTDATWNPIRAMIATPDAPKFGWHCEHVSEACRWCYAEGFNLRLGTGLEYKPGNLAHLNANGDRRGEASLLLDPKMLLLPLRWRRPRKIFVCSMTDLFADFVDREWIDRMFAVMALRPQHVFQVLTKRPQRMRAYFEDPGVDDRIAGWMFAYADTYHGREQAEEWERERAWRYPHRPIPNVWKGTSTEDRAALLDRVGHLRMTPAAKRFLSAEPLLGDLGQAVLSDIDWVIAGGESGRNARPMHPDWARSLRDQCAAAGVPFFFKQWGEWLPVDSGHPGLEGPGFGRFDHCRVNEPGNATHVRAGKKAAGRLLDGVEHNRMPA